LYDAKEVTFEGSLQDSSSAHVEIAFHRSITTSAFYPVVVSEFWHWTGNKRLIQPLLDPTLRAIGWLDQYTHLLGDDFYYYQSHSEQGGKHQGWKDSEDAIVHGDGSQVEPPIVTCEEQGFVYASKLQFAEVLWWMDRKDDAKRLYREAQELKKRFNEVFWMEEQGSAKRCGACSQKAQCTTGRYKYLAIHIHESARQRARELAQTPEFSKAQRQRKKVEALFAELKNQIGLRRLRLRRLKFVREQFFLAAAAQNIKRLVRFLTPSTTPALAATT
jgi:glycogen debranching enzyme